MSKFEKEIKVLDINVEKTQKKLDEIGAEFKGKKIQKIYVYDVPTIYSRFIEIRFLLSSENELLVSTNIKKLETLILEIKDLFSEVEIKVIEEIFSVKLDKVCELPIEILRNSLAKKEIEDIFYKYNINPNKWIRLRKTNDKIELTCKHVFDKEQSYYQNVLENEINVSDFDETNKLLESIGLARRSYQEKVRYSYKYKDAEIEIDCWPKLKPYLEIESDNSNTIEEIIRKLEFNDDNEIISINTEQLYKRIGIDIHKTSELKFDENINW